MSILNILNEVAGTASILEKKAILERNKDNDTLKRVLKLGIDPGIVSGIKKIPAVVESNVKYGLDEALHLLEAIYARQYTGNAARDFIANILGSLTHDDAEVVRRVLSKDLACGASDKIVNEIFGKGFVKDEPYMRCSLVDVKTVKNITSFKTHGYAVSEVKMDGQYLNHTVVNGHLTCTSRNGKLYDFLGTRDEEMAVLAKHIQDTDPRFASGVVFNGEVLMLDNDGAVLPRETSNGIVQKAGKGSITLADCMKVVFVLWDVLPYDAFLDGLWNVERKERREILETAINKTDSEFVRMVEYKKVLDIGEAFDYNSELMIRGEEGSVLKCESGIWKSHTSPKQLKMKLKMFVDLIVVGFNEGEKKRTGMLGSLQLQSSDGVVITNCGTGIKEKGAEWTFQSIWDKRDELLGKVVTISCTGLTVDKRTGQQSIFLPVWEEFRFDKDTADSYERILEIKESAVMVFRNSLTEAIQKK